MRAGGASGLMSLYAPRARRGAKFLAAIISFPHCMPPGEWFRPQVWLPSAGVVGRGPIREKGPLLREVSRSRGGPRAQRAPEGACARARGRRGAGANAPGIVSFGGLPSSGLRGGCAGRVTLRSPAAAPGRGRLNGIFSLLLCGVSGCQEHCIA